VKAEINDATKRAEARPEPTTDDAHERVYADAIQGGGTATPMGPTEGGAH
jgi:TPP-dependent pyruvate/acetoin dehydrogenase alpha subunit